MRLYRTVAREACAEQTIEKSKFIVHVKPVELREEAEEYIESVRKKYRDATHNVPAMVIGNKMQVQWASDDGEPQGTAGAPALHVMTGSEITNAVLVITRYFGGIKLGTGGLVRAYSSTAKMGIEAAGICDAEETLTMVYAFDYTYLAKVQQLCGRDFEMGPVNYSERVEASLICKPEQQKDIETMMADITGGRAILLGRDTGIVKRGLKEKPQK